MKHVGEANKFSGLGLSFCHEVLVLKFYPSLLSVLEVTVSLASLVATVYNCTPCCWSWKFDENYARLFVIVAMFPPNRLFPNNRLIKMLLPKTNFQNIFCRGNNAG